MEPRALRNAEGPETHIKRAFVKVLRKRKWWVMITHGNAVQKGLPDLIASHRNWGIRLVEIKYAEKYSFTVDQRNEFPAMVGAGANIWILSLGDKWFDRGMKEDDPELEVELRKLEKAPNWAQYWDRTKRL